MSLDVAYKESRDVGGCNACDYPDNPSRVYSVRLNSLTFRLCPRHLKELIAAAKRVQP